MTGTPPPPYHPDDAKIPHPEFFSSANRSAEPFSVHRLKLSMIAGLFSLSLSASNTNSSEFADGYIATPLTWSRLTLGMHWKQLILNPELKPDHNYSDRPLQKLRED